VSEPLNSLASPAYGLLVFTRPAEGHRYAQVIGDITGIEDAGEKRIVHLRSGGWFEASEPFDWIVEEFARLAEGRVPLPPRPPVEEPRPDRPDFGVGRVLCGSVVPQNGETPAEVYVCPKGYRWQVVSKSTTSPLRVVLKAEGRDHRREVSQWDFAHDYKRVS
jgi:hypothetical protein